MYSRLIEIFDDKNFIEKIRTKLPYLFSIAELESSRAGRIGMEVGSRWEIKGSRSKEFRLTINQSAVGIDDTCFILYCGFPERNELHGIYCVKGRDVAFSEKRANMNMRVFLDEYYDELLQKIYP